MRFALGFSIMIFLAAHTPASWAVVSSVDCFRKVMNGAIIPRTRAEARKLATTYKTPSQLHAEVSSNHHYSIQYSAKEATITPPMKSLIVSDADRVKSYSLGLQVDNHRTLETMLIIPDPETPIGRFATAMEKNKTGVIISEEWLKEMDSGAQFFPNLSITDRYGREMYQHSVILRDIHFKPGMTVGHEGFHAVSQQQRSSNQMTHSFHAVAKRKSKKPLPRSAHSERLDELYPDHHREEIHTYLKTFVELPVHHRETLQAITEAGNRLFNKQNFVIRKGSKSLDQIHIKSDRVVGSKGDLQDSYDTLKYFAENDAHFLALVQKKLSGTSGSTHSTRALLGPIPDLKSNTLQFTERDFVYSLQNVSESTLTEIQHLRNQLERAMMSKAKRAEITSIAKKLNAIYDQKIIPLLEKQRMNSVAISERLEQLYHRMDQHRIRGTMTANEYLELKDELADFANLVQPEILRRRFLEIKFIRSEPQ